MLLWIYNESCEWEASSVALISKYAARSVSYDQAENYGMLQK